LKKDWILPSCFLIFLLILRAGAAFLPVGGADTIIGSVHFEPDRFDLDYGFGVSVVEATLRFDKPYEDAAKYINVSTILLQGSLSPSSTYAVPGGLVAEFDAALVENIIWGIIYHIDELAPPYKIWLTITGKLNQTAGGTPFSAEGDIKIIVPHSPLPP
jgi:hypothetical protein